MDRRFRVWRLLPPRKSNGAASTTSTRAPSSFALNAAQRPAFPPPTTSTSYKEFSRVNGVFNIYHSHSHLTLLIHLRIGPVTVVSAVSGDMTSEMWLWSLNTKEVGHCPISANLK